MIWLVVLLNHYVDAGYNKVNSITLYLLSDMAGGGVTGEIHYVDAGYNKVGILKTDPKIILELENIKINEVFIIRKIV